MKNKIYFALALLVLGELAFGASAKKYVKIGCVTPEGATVYRDRYNDLFTKNVVRGQAYYFPVARAELLDSNGSVCRTGN
jgi:hypothetical protein